MNGLEIGLYWATVFAYATSSVLFVAGWAFKRRPATSVALWVAAAGLLFHSAALGVRWVELGHGPYIRRYEAFSSNAWVALALYLAVQWKLPTIRHAGALLMPALFLIMGIGALSNPEGQFLSPAMRSPWLVVHVSFAKLSLASLLIASSVSVLYLVKDRKGTSPDDQRRFSLRQLNYLGEKFVALGFYFLTIMIASGAVWANTAWGSYWRWDAIESWSLATWLLYGVCLHLRSTLGWRGRRAAWVTLAGLVVSLVLFFDFGNISQSVHSVYTAP